MKIKLHKKTNDWWIVSASEDIGPYRTKSDAAAALRELRHPTRPVQPKSDREDPDYARRNGDLFDVSPYTGTDDGGSQLSLF